MELPYSQRRTFDASSAELIAPKNRDSALGAESSALHPKLWRK
jgi:hypothetical protein